MSAYEDARLSLDRASKAQTGIQRESYLDQARTLAILAMAESLQHVADELALIAAENPDKPPW